MKKKLLVIIFIFFFISFLQAIEIDLLDKFIWIEKKSYTRGAYTSFNKLEKIPNNYQIYKMKYYNRKTNNILFFVFLYNPLDNKFYDVEEINNGKSYIPLYKFNGLENYTKTIGKENYLEGKYHSNTEDFEEIEIKQVKKNDYKYSIALDYEEKGKHLIYLEGDNFKSDNTFGLCKEEKLEKLFSVDRAESFYNDRNILSSYTNDNFTLNITKNEEFDVEMELKSDIRIMKLIPEALFENDYFFLYSGTEIYDNNYNLIRKQETFKEKVIIIERNYEWIEKSSFLNLFINVQFDDKTTGWIYSNSLLIF